MSSPVIRWTAAADDRPPDYRERNADHCPRKHRLADAETCKIDTDQNDQGEQHDAARRQPETIHRNASSRQPDAGCDACTYHCQSRAALFQRSARQCQVKPRVLSPRGRFISPRPLLEACGTYQQQAGNRRGGNDEQRSDSEHVTDSVERCQRAGELHADQKQQAPHHRPDKTDQHRDRFYGQKPATHRPARNQRHENRQQGSSSLHAHMF
jgi:hypothetical protein